MIRLVRRLALPIALTSLAVNGVITVFSTVLWFIAWRADWVNDVRFVSHVSMLALVFAGVSGVAGALAGILALVPTDDLIERTDQ